MKHLPSLLFLAVLLLYGCGKEGAEGTVSPLGPRMTFSSSSPDAESRATFNDSDDGSMLWSPYDNIGAYSFLGSTLVHSGLCSISIDPSDGSLATFQSEDSRASWAGGSEGTITFYSYYPALGSTAAACTGGTVPLAVSSTQTGEFGRYQICASRGSSLSSERVLDGADVNFQFHPVTSMLRIRPTLTSDSSEESVNIIRLVVSIEDDIPLAGDCRLTLSEGTLAYSGNGSSTITVNLAEAITITKNQSDNGLIPVILLPAVTGGKKLSFHVLTDLGVRLTMSSKTSPAQFQAGFRYTLDRKIATVSSPDSLYDDGGSGWSDDIDDDGGYMDSGSGWDADTEDDSGYTDGDNAW